MKNAVVYYSQTGNTKEIAKKVVEEFNADEFVIEPKKPYKSFMGAIGRVVVEKFTHKQPELASEPGDFSEYETVFVGSPVWAGTLPEFVREYLQKSKFGKARVVPFATAGGSGKKGFLKAIESLLPNNKIKNYLFVPMSKRPDLDEWIQKVRNE